MAALEHPNICPVQEIGEYEGRTFIVMSYIEGRTLKARLAEAALSVDEALDITIQVASGLAAAHAKGIVHRDVKPDNIILTDIGDETGRASRAVLIDFGLAKQSETTLLTRTGTVMGTAAYMSPEQARGAAVDARTDIWSLGVTLYEMLAERRPFEAEHDPGLLYAINNMEPRLLTEAAPDVPEKVGQLVQRTLAKDPQKRISSALDLGNQLTTLAKATLSRLNTAQDRTISSESTRRQGLDSGAVAVLPFANLSGTDDAEFLATGLHNDLLSELSRIPGLTVISRTSVMGYQKTEKSVPQIGRELNVGTIIEGTVQSAGNRVRMTAQLIDAVDDIQRWSERYDRELSPETLFAIQSELTQRIVESLQSKLVPDQVLPVGKLQTGDLEAYRLNTLGRMQLDRRTEAGVRRALELFEQAVKCDPDYALAWVGLADALTLMVSYGYGGGSEALLSRAKESASRALELDPDSAEAHASLGLFYGTIQDGPSSVLESDLAIQIQPSYADAHNWLSYWQNLSGRANEGLKCAKRAVELNPLSAEAVSNLSLSFLTNLKSEEALAEADRTTELSPGWTTADFYKGIGLYDLQRYSEARSVLSDITVEWAGLGAEATLALTHVALGDEALARQVLAGIDPGIDAFAVGMVHLALGEVDVGFDRFFSVDQLSDWPILAVHHLYRDVWNTVKDHPRYQELVRHAYTSYNLEVLR
ncbi:MAG: hypothetical protein DRP71_13535 [Verrucomicrobia bacterium]|nr:MAG: hypothetical protein DRP71_13535 [Verrucomicrobiota bacterium]